MNSKWRSVFLLHVAACSLAAAQQQAAEPAVAPAHSIFKQCPRACRTMLQRADKTQYCRKCAACAGYQSYCAGAEAGCHGVTSCSQLKAAVANANCSSVTIPCGTIIQPCFGISVTRSVSIKGEAGCTSGSCKQQTTKHYHKPPGNTPSQPCRKPIIMGMGAGVNTTNREAIFTVDSTNSSSAIIVLLQGLVLANHSTTGEFLRLPFMLMNEFHLAAGINVMSFAAGPLGFNTGGFKLTLWDMEFKHLTGGGGAMAVKAEASAVNTNAPSDLAIHGCKFVSCKASGWEGAGAVFVHLVAGPVHISNTSFVQNSGLIYGAVAINTVGVQRDMAASVRIQGSSFVENSSSFVGGLFMESIFAREAVVSSCRFVSNVGTGLYFKNKLLLEWGDTEAKLTASQLAFQGNVNPSLSFEDHYPGGMFFWGPQLCLTDAVFAGNIGRAAGALEVGAAKFTGSGITFESNSANKSTGPEWDGRPARGMANTLKIFSVGFDTALSFGINSNSVLSGCSFQHNTSTSNDVADIHVLEEKYGGNTRLYICQSSFGAGGMLLVTTPAPNAGSLVGVGQPSIQMCGEQQPGKDYTKKPGSNVFAFDAATCATKCSNTAGTC